jgi:osmotically-inducible protein OsmY
MSVAKKISGILAISLLSVFAGCSSTAKSESVGQYVDSSVLTTKVKSAIFNEPTLKSLEISVETYKGEVQLSGFVTSQEQVAKAIEVVKGVKGVTGIKNNMIVKGQ